MANDYSNLSNMRLVFDTVGDPSDRTLQQIANLTEVVDQHMPGTEVIWNDNGKDIPLAQVQTVESLGFSHRNLAR